MTEPKPTLGIFGAGWVGLVTGACFADLGHEVVVRDVVPAKIEELNAGRLPFHELGLAELIERNRERLTFTLDADELKANAQIFFSCVDTPPMPSGEADLAPVWSVVEDLGEPEDATLVMKSTVPVGTGERVRDALGGRVGYVSNPEFLSEGRAIEDFRHPDRVVIGAFDDEHGDRVAALYEGFGAPIVRASVPSAEMVKLASNAFLATRISFINEIANVSEAVGADVDQVAQGMGLDQRIGRSYLKPGVGYGGSCLTGDQTVLVRRGSVTSLMTLQAFFHSLTDDELAEIVLPDGVEVLSWRPGADAPEFMPVAAATRRWYEGEVLEIRTKMGRRVRCTPDHPFLAAPRGEAPTIKEAAELSSNDWLPLAQGRAVASDRPPVQFELLAGLRSAGLENKDVIVRRDRSELASLGTKAIREQLSDSRSQATAATTSSS